MDQRPWDTTFGLRRLPSGLSCVFIAGGTDLAPGSVTHAVAESLLTKEVLLLAFWHIASWCLFLPLALSDHQAHNELG